MPWWIAYAFVGWGFASWVFIRHTLPDPPPDFRAWLIASIAGLVGGAFGAYLGAISSEMIGAPLIGALAGTSILLALTRVFVRASAIRKL